MANRRKGAQSRWLQDGDKVTIRPEEAQSKWRRNLKKPNQNGEQTWRSPIRIASRPEEAQSGWRTDLKKPNQIGEQS
ncbi:hypothetical protein RRG08_000399 [Elysia crispata]|uniref:Uncharacterized protein n=1 Tax=Elysia crispata TaxID=231223 RepID=A0AAE0ZTX0_9GAST|nr:hypothetical protein RRG08_000399 [Elysia crispata]